MAFTKKVLVLKQVVEGFSLSKKPIGGIARIETENGVTDFHLSLINFSATTSGGFFAYIVDDKKRTIEFDLGKRPSFFSTALEGSTDYSTGFAVGVCFINNDIPTTIAFAREDGFNFCLTDFKKAVAEKRLETRRLSKKNEEITKPMQNTNTEPIVTKAEEFSSNNTVEYNDEAVATENYYLTDKQINDKLLKLKEIENDRIRFEDEFSFDRSKEETNSCAENLHGDNVETDLNTRQDLKTPFFNTVKKELTELLNKYPEEQGLSKIFPNGKFVRIYYSEKKYYVVGVVLENDKEKYVCYGVPATYSPEAPKELKGYCQFIPLSIFDLTGDGFWMMFQDAKSGECIKLK